MLWYIRDHSASYNSLYGVQLRSTNFRQDFSDFGARIGEEAGIHLRKIDDKISANQLPF